MLQHPYSFLQSARAHCKAVLKYAETYSVKHCPEFLQESDPAFRSDFERLGQETFPPKGSQLEEYQPLVSQYVNLLQRACTLLGKVQVATILKSEPVGHLDKRLKEINKDLSYHKRN